MNIAVLGGGSWGTALAKVLSDRSHNVKMWVYEKELVEIINSTNENTYFLPNFKLSKKLFASNDIVDCIKDAELIINAIPSHIVRSVFEKIKNDIPLYIPIVSASKGIEKDTSFLISEILEDVLDEKYHYYLLFLSGPSFAKEVAQGQPTLLTLASINNKLNKKVQKILSSLDFRIYITNDVIGVEIGGALKNVIAIGAGIISGLGYGANTRAALLTRGLAEMNRFSMKRGANPLTLSGLSGIGDLMLTATSKLSRNWTVGYRLGNGEKLSEIKNSMKMIAEGIENAQSIYLAAQKLDIEMPIFTTIYKVLYENLSLDEAKLMLMDRSLKKEIY